MDPLKLKLPSTIVSVDKFLPMKYHQIFKRNGLQLESSGELDRREDRIGLVELVDPLLYLLVEDVTKYAVPAGSKFTAPFGADDVGDVDVKDSSKRFQLIPTDFYVELHSKKVTLNSYINNLDPREYDELYKGIEILLEKVVPQFEQVLSKLAKLDGKNKFRSDLDFGGRNLQVVVGIKSIHLTPANPKYAGSQWHTEGMKNDRIVASAIYYYDVENIPNSELVFRKSTPGTETVEIIGSVVAETNRLVVFPNVYEHVVFPFELGDSSVPGHRKFITMFLVDPAYKIISTSVVPPQQKEWNPISTAGPTEPYPFPFLKGVECSTMTLDMAKTFRKEARLERNGGEPKQLTKSDFENVNVINVNHKRRRERMALALAQSKKPRKPLATKAD